MTHFEVWIAHCQLAHIELDGEYQCQAAIWAESHYTAIHLLAKYLDPQGYRILWVDECEPARLYSRDSSEITTNVYEGLPVVLGPIMSTDGQVGASKGYLSIEEIEGVEPLDSQFGIWPLKSVPDALKKPLFGQPEPTKAEVELYGSTDKVPPMKTYAILDAAKVFGLVEMLETSGLEYCCLFKGNAAEEYRDVAPYLIELKDDDPFTRLLVTHMPNQPENMTTMHLWHKQAGIFVRSRATFDDIWGHFRKFTKVQDENKKWYFFRFWEPVPAAIYFDAIKSDAQKYLSWFFLHRKSEIYSIITPDPKNRQCKVFRARKVILFHDRSAILFQLGAAERTALQHARIEADITELTELLIKSFPEQTSKFETDSLNRLIRKSASRIQEFGIKQRDYLLRLIALDLHTNGAFEREDPNGKLREILEMDTPQADKMRRLTNRFRELENDS